jgi:hypothetical protein
MTGKQKGGGGPEKGRLPVSIAQKTIIFLSECGFPRAKVSDFPSGYRYREAKTLQTSTLEKPASKLFQTSG